ncbi:MAG: hypothetical protein E7Z70_01665 [Thermoplasmata archaeon]|nr:hypothetical protein [Thermoplasmata archaeon]
MVKHDVIAGKQSFLGWFNDNLMDGTSNWQDRDWYFYSRPRIRPKGDESADDWERKKREVVYGNMTCMHLSRDGDIDFRIYQESELEEDPVLRLCWSQFSKENQGIKGVISDGDNVYSLLPTDVKMIPEIDKIRNDLRAKEDYDRLHPGDKMPTLRTEKNRDLYIKACTNIRKHVDFNTGDTYYFVGERVDADNREINWACNLHKIKVVDSEDGIPVPEYMFNMMLVPFVRLHRGSVVPYPIKYLHEYERIQDIEDYSPDEDEEKTDSDLGIQQDKTWVVKTLFDF